MGKYVVKRLLQLIPTLLILSLVIFLMVRLIPGDPVQIMLGTNIDKSTYELERARLGLNDPLYVQYFRFIGNALKGDLGTSIFTGKAVMGEILVKYRPTILLAFFATIVASVLGVVFGIIAAMNRGKFVDRLIMVVSLVFVSTPSFFLALLLMMVFCVQLKWFPSIAVGNITIKTLILPITTLGVQGIGSLARTTRSAMLDVISQDYIRTSKSRGIPSKVITFSHCLKNSLIPVITSIGLRFGSLLAGATVTETVFSISGVGRFLVDGVNNRDYPVVQGTVLVLAVTFVLVNLITDLIYAAVDPRVKYN